VFGPELVYQRRVEDRRAAPRQEAYVSAALETPAGRTTIAITRDISARGLLLLTRAALEVGEVVKLTVPRGDAQETLSGTVVRTEPLDGHELWRHKVAITVAEGDPVFAGLHAALSEAKPPG
jgi:hypothetical protein